MNRDPSYSDQELLEMLLRDDRRQEAMAYLYRAARKHVLRLVLKYGGEEADALELLSEGLLVFLQNIEQGKFRGGSQLKVYLIGICKYLWRGKRKQRQREIPPIDPDMEPVLEESVSAHLERMDTVQAVQSCLAQLKEACRELFRWRYFEGRPAAWEVIAERLGYENAQVARNKGQRCMKSLKTIYLKQVSRGKARKP